MAYIILWVFFLIATLAWFAAALATPTRVSNVVLRWSLRLLLAAPSIAGWSWLVTVTWETRAVGILHATDAWTTWILAAIYIATSIYFFTRRWWRRAPPPLPARAAAEAELNTTPASAQSASAHEPLRRRTVLALYGLALLCLSLHVFTLFILKRAVIGTLEAAQTELQTAVQVQLNREKAQWADAIARHEKDPPGAPADAIDALIAFTQTADDKVNQRRLGMLSRMELWREYFTEGHMAFRKNDQRAVLLLNETVADNTGKTFTLRETLADFRQELADLREATQVTPPNANFGPERFRSRPNQQPLPQLFTLPDLILIDGRAAMAAGDLPRALADLQAVTRLLTFPAPHNEMLADFSPTITAARQELAEDLLSAPNLTAAIVDDLPLLEPEIGRRQVAPKLDQWLLFRVYRALIDARTGQSHRTADFFYADWLDLAYWVPNDSADAMSTRNAWQQPLTQPYLEIFPALEVPADRPGEGLGGHNLRKTILVMVEMATAMDTREDLLRVAQAAARYRLKHGRYPESLDKLTPGFLPALPPDRFTGKPLLFRVDDDGQGLALWSVGPDRFDNQAAPSNYYDEAEPDLTLFLGAARERVLEVSRKARQARLDDAAAP